MRDVAASVVLPFPLTAPLFSSRYWIGIEEKDIETYDRAGAGEPPQAIVKNAYRDGFHTMPWADLFTTFGYETQGLEPQDVKCRGLSSEEARSENRATFHTTMVVGPPLIYEPCYIFGVSLVKMYGQRESEIYAILGLTTCTATPVPHQARVSI